MTRDDAINILLDHLSAGLIRTLEDAIAKEEREECARICEDLSNTEANMNQAWRNGCESSADAIRARSK